MDDHVIGQLKDFANVGFAMWVARYLLLKNDRTQNNILKMLTAIAVKVGANINQNGSDS